MRIRHRLRGAQALARALVTLSLLVTACAAVPYQQMSDARQAIESARPVVMDHPGPASQVDKAQSLLDQAEAHLRAAEYDRARETAEQAKRLAIEAREAAAESDYSRPRLMQPGR